MKRVALVMVIAGAAWAVAQSSEPMSEKPPMKAEAGKANAAKPAGAAYVETQLPQLEESLWAAWKGNDTKPFEQWLEAGASLVDPGMGKMSKAEFVKQMKEQPCKVNSYALSDTKVTKIDADAALITYTATMDASCNGQKLPEKVYASSVWAKRGAKWQAVMHQETAAMPAPAMAGHKH